MIAVSYIPKGRRASDGKQIVETVVVSDDTPEILPVTGEGITGMSIDDCFAPMSILYVTADVEHKVYIANESGIFIAQ